MNKQYSATRTGGRARIEVAGGGKRNPLKHIVRHSPDGFEWGYGGSGPSDTALSIMMDYFGGWPDGSRKATKNYQQFKWEFIANAPQEGFVITTKQIEAWLLDQDHARGVCPCEMCQSRWVGNDEATGFEEEPGE